MRNSTGKIACGIMLIILGLLVTFITISIANGNDRTADGYLPLAILFIIGGICGIPLITNGYKERKYEEEEDARRAIENKKKADEHMIQIKATTDWCDNVYPTLIQKYGVHKKNCIFIQRGGNNSQKTYIWVKDGVLNMFPALSERKNEAIPEKRLLAKYILRTIPVKDIEYFKLEGEVYRETKISGGGGSGGGSSLGGAIIGGMIAGDTGAIIGSRKDVKVEAIKSDTITHDTRTITLSYFENTVVNLSRACEHWDEIFYREATCVLGFYRV